MGSVGLTTVGFEAHFAPAVEIVWRLAAEHWGHGYATEAARAVLRFGFEQLEMREIVAFTVPHNHRSRRVMESSGCGTIPERTSITRVYLKAIR